MYIKRHAESTIENLSKTFGVVLVDGPRQSGKTTMLRHCTEGVDYISLDDPILRVNAAEAATTFLKDNPPPILIDEIQKAPELFPRVRQLSDDMEGKGLFYLCGSQQFQTIRDISRSSGGRLGLITLTGLSMREKFGCGFNEPFIPTEAYFKARESDLQNIDYSDLWHNIHLGAMPELFANSSFEWNEFYGNFVRTYIERDVRELTNIGDEVKFMKFMSALAARTGQLLNLNSMTGEVGISQPTAQRWLSVLIASNIVYLLRPYSPGDIKRGVRTSRLYFLDTGLAAYLTRWPSAEIMKTGAMGAVFFKNHIISEIIKSYYNKGVLEPPLYFYKDKDQREIDLLIREGDVIHPLLIEKHADPKPKDVSVFKMLDKIQGLTRGSGGIICTRESFSPLNDKDWVIPVSYI